MNKPAVKKVNQRKHLIWYNHINSFYFLVWFPLTFALALSTLKVPAICVFAVASGVIWYQNIKNIFNNTYQ